MALSQEQNCATSDPSFEAGVLKKKKEEKDAYCQERRDVQ